MANHTAIIAVVALSSCLVMMSGCGPEPGTVLDEALEVGVKAEDLPGSADDYLRDMDRGWDKDHVHEALAAALKIDQSALSRHFSKDVVWNSYNRGRNNWVVWTAGNDRLWDFLANNTFGAFDLLKTLSSHPNIKYCGNKNPEDGYGDVAYEKKAGKGSATYPKDGPSQYPEGYRAYDYSKDEECQNKDDRKFFMASRDHRWKYFGLVNEPGFKKWDPKDCDGDKWKNDKKTEDHPYGKCGNPDRFGLWLDQRIGNPDPFEDETKYPGVKFGARGRDGFSAGSYYGYGTGIVGLRLFPNPDFDEEAEKNWDPVKYYQDPTYYEDKNLVRPFRVGMSCGFCHVGPSPINPPDDYENPEWRNLTSNPGAQYFWIDKIFFWNPKGAHENFIYQLFHTSLPGSLDTSLVSSDNINNPRTMNAVYSIAARMDMAKHAREKLTGGELNNKQFNHYDRTRLLSEFFQPPDTVLAPHVLKDGADSVGILGALNRVYINIGLFSEEWLLHFKPLLGGRISPIEIAVLQRNSTYWNANVAQTPDLALFFLAGAQPDYLKDAPGGHHYLTNDEKKLTRGKEVFAKNCARCHSGKQPENLCPLGSPCKDGDIIEHSAGYFEWMQREVLKDDFLDDNFLSTERRIPVTELGTNACSPLATNGIRGDIWNDFTSTTYKELPAVGKVTVHHPKTGEPWEYEIPGGGRGYTRPASLIGLWSTAPFLLNNSVGNFYGAATVEGRLASFNDSIQKMLWPKKRLRDDEYVKYLRYYASDRDDFRGYKGLGNIPGYIQRTTSTSYLRIPARYLPDPLDGVVGMSRFLPKLAPWLFSEREWGVLELGPIPAGTPVSLLASLQPMSESTRLKDRKAHLKKVVRVLGRAVKNLKSLPKEATDEEAREVFGNLVDPLVELSKCPDYVVNRGHYFGSHLNDEDKWALIEFLKTF